VVPAIVSGTFTQPKFAPNAEQMAKLKISGLFSGGVKCVINGITGKPPDSNAAPGDATPQGAMNDLFNKFFNKN